MLAMVVNEPHSYPLKGQVAIPKKGTELDLHGRTPRIEFGSTALPEIRVPNAHSANAPGPIFHELELSWCPVRLGFGPREKEDF